jgi:hypothetical protein
MADKPEFWPIFKNWHHERILFLATPRGVSVTIHPGDMVSGEYFRSAAKENLMTPLTEEEARDVKREDLTYCC